MEASTSHESTALQDAADLAASRRQAGVLPRKDQSPEPEHPGNREPLRRRAGGRSPDGMRRRSDQGRPARADRRAQGAPRQQEVSVRGSLVLSTLAVFIGVAAAQTPPPPPPPPSPPRTPANANLRPI